MLLRYEPTWTWDHSEPSRGDILLTAIAERLLSEDDPPSPELAGGTAGLALVHAGLARARPGAGHGARARQLLEQTVGLVGEQELQAGLWAGLAGIGWALERLREPEEDPCAALDEPLLELALGATEEDSLDWAEGLAGLAPYAEARLPRREAVETLRAIVAALEARAEIVSRGVAWLVSPPLYALGGRGRYDLGVAHGQPGVLCALSIAARAGIDGAMALLTRGVSGFLGLIPDEATLPASVGGLSQPGLPHAWCYGPLGAGAVLAGIGARLGLASWKEEGIRLAATTQDLPSLSAQNAGLCHGRAGAMILCRSAGLGGQARRFRQELEAGALPEGPELLEGLGGVALALAPEQQAWLPLLGLAV